MLSDRGVGLPTHTQPSAGVATLFCILQLCVRTMGLEYMYGTVRRYALGLCGGGSGVVVLVVVVADSTSRSSSYEHQTPRAHARTLRHFLQPANQPTNQPTNRRLN